MTLPAKPLDEQIDEILEKILPIPFQGYNQGLLPDEEGYSSPVLEIQYRVEERREEAKAALNQLIAQAQTEARIDELEYLISDPPIFGKTLHTDLFGLAPAIDDNWSETKDAGYNNGMREAQNRVKRRIAALRAEGK
jgi:hypothetical protein